MTLLRRLLILSDDYTEHAQQEKDVTLYLVSLVNSIVKGMKLTFAFP